MASPLVVTRFTLLPEPRPMGGEQVLATATVEAEYPASSRYGNGGLRRWDLFLMRTINRKLRVWWRKSSTGAAALSLQELAHMGGINRAIIAAYEDERVNMEELS